MKIRHFWSRPLWQAPQLKRTRTKAFLFALAIVGPTLHAFSQDTPRAQTFSVNAVGYHEVHVPAGFYLVANNLNYKSNLLNDVLPLPEWAGASEFHKFDAQRQQYFESTHYLPGWGWLSALSYAGLESEPNLKPGEGAFLRVLSNGVPAPITLTFVGDVPPRSCATIYAGWNQWSPSLGGDLSEIRPVDGDTVFTYDMLNQAYRDPWQYIEGLGWLNASDPDFRGPRIPPGQCVFLFTYVARNPCVFEGVGPASVLSPLAGVALINPARSGSSFSFEYIAEAGRIHQVQSTDSFPATWTSQGEPIIGVNQRVNFTHSTATGPSRYYRLLIQ